MVGMTLPACSPGSSGPALSKECRAAWDVFYDEATSLANANDAKGEVARRWRDRATGLADGTLDAATIHAALNEPVGPDRERVMALYAEVDPNRIVAALAGCNQSSIPDDCRDLFAQFKATADAMPAHMQADVALLDTIEPLVNAARTMFRPPTQMETFDTAFNAYQAAAAQSNALTDQWNSGANARAIAADKCNAALP